MATKLKNLKIKKVDFVDEGANPDAHIRMVKRKGGPEQSVGDNGEKNVGFVSRLFSFIGKAAGMNQEEINSAMDEIQKGDSVSFGEKYNEAKNRKIADEIWDICYALQSSLCSILNDEELDGTSAATAMEDSLGEFTEVVKEAISNWSSGKAINIVKNEEVSEVDLSMMKSAVERLNDSIEKASGACSGGGKPKDKKKDQQKTEKSEGDEEEMKIDKSKLTTAERLILEDIEKRYGTEETPAVPEQPVATETPAVAKSTAAPQTQETHAEEQTDANDIYKGLNPAVKAELESLKKFREDAETRELEAVAGKYEIIGKKKEDLVPLFKSLRAAGGTAYNDMIAVLDSTVEAVNKSGVFSEIGKSGHGVMGTSDAEGKIDAIAKGYMAKEPAMSYTAAVAKAWEDNPELMDAYDEEAGF